MHDAGLECILQKIHDTPDSVLSDTNWVKKVFLSCINETLVEYGEKSLDSSEYEKVWLASIDAVNEIEVSAFDNEDLPFFVSRENIAEKPYTEFDTTFLFKMKKDINEPSNIDSVLAQLKHYIGIIEKGNIGLSEEAEYDYLLLLHFIRNDLLYHQTLLTDRKDFLDSVRSKVRPHRIR